MIVRLTKYQVLSIATLLFASASFAIAAEVVQTPEILLQKILNNHSKSTPEFAGWDYSSAYEAFWGRDYVSAFSDIEAAIKEHPTDARFWYYRSLIQDRLGEKAEAKFSLRVASVLRLERSTPRTKIGAALRRVQGNERLAMENDFSDARRRQIAGSSSQQILAAALDKRKLDLELEIQERIAKQRLQVAQASNWYQFQLVAFLQPEQLPPGVGDEDEIPFTTEDLASKVGDVLKEELPTNEQLQSLKTASSLRGNESDSDWISRLETGVVYDSGAKEIRWTINVRQGQASDSAQYKEALIAVIREALQRVRGGGVSETQYKVLTEKLEDGNGIRFVEQDNDDDTDKKKKPDSNVVFVYDPFLCPYYLPYAVTYPSCWSWYSCW